MIDLKKIREKLGLNQSQFARLLGVTSVTIWQMESGIKKVSFLMLKRIAKKTSISFSVKESGIEVIYND